MWKVWRKSTGFQAFKFKKKNFKIMILTDPLLSDTAINHLSSETKVDMDVYTLNDTEVESGGQPQGVKESRQVFSLVLESECFVNQLYEHKSHFQKANFRNLPLKMQLIIKVLATENVYIRSAIFLKTDYI